MKSFLQQPSTGIFGRSFAEKADQAKASRSFDKVIFKDMPIQNPWSRSNKSSKDKIKLFRFRKGAPTQDQLTLFRTPQSRKSLKSVRNITLTTPSRKSIFVKIGVDHLRLFLGRITRCPTIRLNLRADGNLKSPEAKFSYLWSGIFKELRKYDPKNLKINIQARWTYDKANSEDLSWKRSTFRLLEFMKNVKFLHLNVTIIGREAQFRDDQSRGCCYATRMKHLAKLKEIEIAGMENITDDSVAAYKCALAPPALERVIITGNINNSELSQSITESLNKLKNLKYFTFQGNLEIAKFLSVSQTHPGLNTVKAIGSWSYDVKNIPGKTLAQGFQLKNITHLYLCVYLPVKSKQDCIFYKKLMGTLVNLKSFRIGFDTIKKTDLAGEYADILAPLKKVTRLELALSLTPDKMAKFFSKMRPLQALKHFVFVANIQPANNAKNQFPQVVEHLKELLLGLKKLELFEMHFHMLGVVFLKGVCQVMLALQKLQSITLSFKPDFSEYLDSRDKMIKQIQKTVKTITNTQELSVIMTVPGVRVPKELVECQNKNLEKFKFTLEDELPGYIKIWL